MVASLLLGGHSLAFVPGLRTPPAVAPHRAAASPATMVIGQQAESFGPAAVIRSIKEKLPQSEWLASGEGAARNKVDMPDHVKEILAQPHAPKRVTENQERTDRIRGRFEQAAADALELRGMLVGEEDAKAWWRTPRDTPKGGRPVTKDDPLTVLVTGGSLALEPSPLPSPSTSPSPTRPHPHPHPRPHPAPHSGRNPDPPPRPNQVAASRAL